MTNEYSDLGEEITAQILDTGLAADAEIKGCSAEEIDRIERECEVALPEAYRSYLQHIGKSAGDFLRGYTCHYPQIIQEQAKAERVVKRETTATELDRHRFVFAGSQGVTFFYFDVRKPDPPVYVIADGHGEPDKVTDSFSEWLFETLAQQT
ncbi:SMI1/KNR4 family protein [Halogeometricum borinquense]|uniref:SMI1/KNR4 family protein n=1 Tax=Halogeometricum borinquense TaxID=60847 RepID=A0A6C0UGA2_9EURY|nr:SMI1/KNR4 family protein [Halogeometricum borinquense]QIB74506.1 SMI1/KNR4 family protein [Halogeometricum borinquense]